jgi:hypothetical protein
MSDRHHRQVEIGAFIGRLRERPWIEPTLVDMIAHGLRTAACDSNPALWEELREVIRDDEDHLTMADQLTQISRITGLMRTTMPTGQKQQSAACEGRDPPRTEKEDDSNGSWFSNIR